MIISMTGYGNYECENEKISFLMEVKSVNSKFYESNLKIPYLFSEHEEKINNMIQGSLKRGRVNFSLSYTIKDSKYHSLTLDKIKLKNYLNILNDLKISANINEEIKLNDILNFQDILGSDKKIKDHSIDKLLYVTKSLK